jgi:multidrug efflux pump subunit AcrB
MKKAIKFFVKFPIWADLLVLLIVGFGFISLRSMNVNFFPEIEQRNIKIQVAFPGASPQEVEEGITLKIEDALKGLQGVEQITSVSSENISTIIVEGKKGYNPDELLSDVKNAVDKINSFPADAEKPVVFKDKPTERVATLLLEADVDLLTLKKNAQIIEDELLASGIVSQVSLSGFPDWEISIEISEENLRRYGLRFEDIANAIRRNNIDISAGSLKSEDEEVLIRFRNKKYNAVDIGNIVLRTKPDGTLLRINDVATVKEQFSENPNKTLYMGDRAVTIQVNKTPEEDMITISNYVKEYIKKYNEKSEVLKLVMSNDSSKLVRQRIALLTKNGWMGLILVIIVLSIFLNVRLSFWVAFAIPVSFMGMFIIAYLAGITINVISLFGMILVIGILVDDGIVISENIYSHYEKGKSAWKAAIDGTSEVFTSVFASVSTTIVMFMPFFFLEGRMGEAFWNMALVVVSCLGISLLEGAFVLPAHLAHSKALTAKKEKSKIREKIDGVINYLRYNLYGKAVHKTLDYRYIVLAVAIFFILSINGMMQGGIIQSTFFPFVDSDNITIDLTLQPGTRENKTEEILKFIESKVWEANKELSKDREDSLNVVLSTRIDIGTNGTSERGIIDVELLDGETRNLESFKIAQSIREKVGIIPEADKLTFGGRQIFGKPVALSITNKDLDVLDKAKQMILNELKAFPTLKDVNDNNVLGRREIKLELKPLAYFLGLSTQDIARQIRQGFFGEEIQRLQIGDDEVKVWVRYPKEDRKDIGQLEEIKIKLQDGKEYPLTELVSYTIERGIVTINHMNGAREIKIEADLADQNTPVPPIMEKIKNDVVTKVIEKYPGTRISFEGQDKENQKFQRSAQKAFPIAIAVMIIIIVLTFRSWYQMLLIIAMIPFGIYGAFAGHGIEAKPVSVFSFYGIIALTGVVINDAVVFLDKFNSNIRLGMKIKEAVYNAGISRFRAILLTSLTTTAGLYPLILEKSRQAQFLIPMAISISWGVVFATVFTLFLFPNLILIFNDIKLVLKWLWTGKKPTNEELEPALIEQKKLVDEHD